jgi:penicillin-binding protein 2
LLLFIGLFFLQIIRGPYYAGQARESRIRTVAIQGVRGRITDRYGRTLAATKLVYSALLSPGDVTGAELNGSIYAALVILKNAGVQLSCTIPITVRDGTYAYTSTDNAAFLTETKLLAKCTATEAVDALTKRYKASAVPKDALLDVLAVRLQLNRQRYRAYRPVRLGLFEDVTLCAQFAENSALMPGVSSDAVPVRVYPNGTQLCHVLGYMGRISAEDAEDYKLKGYDVNADLVGKSGIEALFEPVLHPVPGEVTVSVDSTGRRNAVLNETPSKDGQSLVLTIDARLQGVAQKALEDTMAKIRNGTYGERFAGARIGAVVAMDTGGEVLAMASVPGYDPNAFLSRMDEQTWDALNPNYFDAGGSINRDPTLPRPLVNNAIINAFAPGSVFKPVTALCALEAGVVSETETILDQGRFTYFSQTDAPACWTYNDSHETHGLVDMRRALAVSCNYYFYEMGVRVGSEALEAMAKKLGLGGRTSLGLPGEAQGQLDSKTSSDDETARGSLDQMKTLLPGVDETGAKQAIHALLQNSSQANAQKLFAPIGFSAVQIKALYEFIDQYRWRPSRILAAAIGQGDTCVTVLQMASAIAAITQRGLRFVPRLLHSLPDSSGEAQPIAACDAFLKPSSVRIVMGGMREAVLTGTARKWFSDCAVPVSAKTGTAQSTGRDAFAWFVAYAPADNPRIVVAVMIAQGGHGAYAAPVARAVLEAYFEQGKGTEAPRPQSLLP